MGNTVHSLQVVPRIPAAIGRLEELARNLWFSWSPQLRELYALLDPELWLTTESNPRLFLRCLPQPTLDRAAADETFLAGYRDLLAQFEAYLEGAGAGPSASTVLEPGDLIAYFSAEYGFHESFPIYSGGLGILAGDHCKTASDLKLPFVGVGLLYRQGYFRQRIDRRGQQIPEYPHIRPGDMAIRPALTPAGDEAVVECPFFDHSVHAKVWQADVGRVRVLLLDTNIPANSPEDREITNVLYGGDKRLRLQQEAVLGIGGIRALRAVGIEPTVWHMNEGHAAFSVVERARELVARGLPFGAAWEAVATSTLFTTHTPVAAGHDVFPTDLVAQQFSTYLPSLGIPLEELLALGNSGSAGAEFNMTKLALHGSSSVNGVSRIHRRVSSEIFRDTWPEIRPVENPVGYVTNGVHVPTFLRQAWAETFDHYLGENWQHDLSNEETIGKIMQIPDGVFWHTNQVAKQQMLHALRARLSRQWRRNGLSEAHIHRLLRHVDPESADVLTIGFARRFATYKRSTLLFSDLGWLESLVTNEERPIVFVFAGKAHPADEPGQAMMREIQRISSQAPFIGRVLLLEGYDMGVGRLLTYGVDVWLNTPIHPHEASGTSGMKASINGTVNLSVLDGWWAEAYDGTNGWGIPPSLEDQSSGERDRKDAETLYEILQDEVVPLYYSRNADRGFSPGWVEICKRAMVTALPHFNSQRVVNDYLRHYYAPAAARGRAIARENFSAAHTLAAWKRKVRSAWSGVELHHVRVPEERVTFGESVALEVEVALNGLDPADIRVECVLTPQIASVGERSERTFSDARTVEEGILQIGDTTSLIRVFSPLPGPAGERHRYALDLAVPWPGVMSYAIRAVPFHATLAHPYDMGLMRWL